MKRTTVFARALLLALALPLAAGLSGCASRRAADRGGQSSVSVTGLQASGARLEVYSGGRRAAYATAKVEEAAPGRTEAVFTLLRVRDNKPWNGAGESCDLYLTLIGEAGESVRFAKYAVKLLPRRPTPVEFSTMSRLWNAEELETETE